MESLKNIFIFLFLLSFSVVINAQDQIEVSQRQDLFKAGDAGIFQFRIPSMITTIKGTVIAVCDARVDRGGDAPNNIDLAMRRLLKGSDEWTEVKRIVNFAGMHAAGDPSLTQDRQTGRIFLFYGFCPGFNEVQEGSLVERRHIMLQYVFSDDDGISWSNPVHVDYAIRQEGWQSVWSGPGRGTQLKSGRLMIPCTINKSTNVRASVLVYSDDHGDTWDVMEVAEHINEPTLVELGNGNLMINARNHRIEPPGYRVVTVSEDGGKTWSKPENDPELPDPKCMGSFIRHVFKTDKGEKDLLILSNCSSGTERKNMTVKLSDDNGKTWKYEKVIHGGPSAYSCLTITPEENIGLLYENGDKKPHERISFVEIDILY